MLLEHGESLVRSAYATLDRAGQPSDDAGPGVLYLTTHRLLFERGRTVPFGGGRAPRTVLEASLRGVRDAGVRRGRIGRPRLVLDLGASRPSFDVLLPDEWVGAIAQAKRALPPPGAAPTVVHTIERQVVKVRCRHCGGLGNEVDGRCPSCGAPL